MRIKFLFKAIPLALATAFSATATADNLVTFNPILASWSNGTPSGNVRYYNNNSANPFARWGSNSPESNNSGYDFLAAPVPLNVNVPLNSASALFDLGYFIHQNRPITAGTSITGIDLALTTGVYVDNQFVDTYDFVFRFAHNETPNGANPCADGGNNGQGVNINGCADNVSTSWATTSDVFEINDVEYTLNIRGFEYGGGQFTSFWTKEDAANRATLRAQVVTRADLEPDPDPDVPEPATLALLGLGLAGLAGARRRQRTA